MSDPIEVAHKAIVDELNKPDQGALRGVGAGRTARRIINALATAGVLLDVEDSEMIESAEAAAVEAQWVADIQLRADVTTLARIALMTGSPSPGSRRQLNNIIDRGE